MEIGNMIRKYRLEKNMTQAEVAARLGITAPVVNKWEKSHTMPDITLLSPIARLLDISLDVLLSHTRELSDEEANRLILSAHDRLKKPEPFESVFVWAKEQLRLYPNSAFLSLYMAGMLQSHLQTHPEEAIDEYTPFLFNCYQHALESENEGIRSSAADALYYHFMQNKEFDRAEAYLTYFSKENPERKRKEAAIYQNTGRKDEALRMYEELLYAGYQSIHSTFYDIYHLALKDEDYGKAHHMADKMKRIAQLFELGEYHEVSSGLELAILEQDRDSFFHIMQRLLCNVESIAGFTRSSLYSHMAFQQPREEYYDEVRRSLLDCLKEDQCAFAHDDARFAALFETY